MLALAGCAGDEQSEAPAVPTAESATPAPAPITESVTPEPVPAPVGEEDAPANAEEVADPVDVADATDAAYEEVVANFRAAETLGTFFDDSYGYAVFPTIGKGGFVIGGAYGKGRAYVDGEVTGTTSVTQASIGLQAGGQAFSQIIFFENQAAYEDFTSGNFEFDAKAEAVAITAGASAQAGTAGNTASAGDAQQGAGKQAAAEYKNGMATFSYAKGGLMAGAAIGGQKFKFEPAG